MFRNLQPRNSLGQAITAGYLREDSSLKTLLASSPLDTPERSHSSSLSSLENRSIVPFPELEVPILDFGEPTYLEPPPHHTKKEPLTPIFTVLNYNLDLFFALAQPIAKMPATEAPQIFHGDGRKTENPADFLKSFNHAMRQQSISSSSDKLDAFRDYLGTGSEAEVWFKALAASDKATWTVFHSTFEIRWPPIVVAKKTQVEYEKELLEYLLTDVEVGMKTTQYDRECWSHEAWATKALQLTSSAGITTNLLKNDEYANWEEFTKEVKELKGSRLLLRTDVACLQQRNPQNPITALQNQFSHMSVNPLKILNTPLNSNVT
ncbi:hypothetical protein DFH29DRAFT_1000958 [Suillus ampliporus]|nr:hypothetical protein DFH29DRAFT_1000958 [Suillus ampliporus]